MNKIKINQKRRWNKDKENITFTVTETVQSDIKDLYRICYEDGITGAHGERIILSHSYIVK